MATLPVVLDLTIYRRATFTCQFRWRASDNTPQDFTGWTGLFRVGRMYGPVLAEMPATLGPDGLIRVQMSAATTTLLPLSRLAHELDLTDSDGIVIRFLRGRANVISDVEPA